MSLPNANNRGLEGLKKLHRHKKGEVLKRQFKTVGSQPARFYMKSLQSIVSLRFPRRIIFRLRSFCSPCLCIILHAV